MPKDNQALTRRLTIIAGLFVALFVCLTIHGAVGNQFSPAQPSESHSPLLINPELLQNWLPKSSYQYVISGIDNYLQVKGLQASTMTITSDITLGPDSYNFNVQLQPQNQTYHIAVMVDNFSGIISTAMDINGQLQNPTVSSQASNGAQISGLGALVNQGVTVTEANDFVVAIQKYSSTVASVSINTDSITPSPPNPNGTPSIITYTFTVSINNTTYAARLECPSLTAIELFLTNPSTNKQVFDSGVINSQR